MNHIYYGATLCFNFWNYVHGARNNVEKGKHKP
jgi:hypothetical protein